jgi:sugar-specific transcriptional regulator TrmB
MDIKETLRELKFTQYDSSVYLALLRLGPSPARDISKESGIAKNKVYESLIRLAERGFISSLDLVPRVYKISNVEKLRNLVEKKEDTLKALSEGISLIEENLTKGFVNQKDVATVLLGKPQIVAMLSSMSPKIKNYQYSFGGGLSYNQKGARVVREAINRGVDVRFLVHKVRGRREVILKWKKLGAKVRYFPDDTQHSVRFSSLDGKYGRITIGKPQIERYEDYLSFWIESPAFSLLLKDQFLQMWERSIDA